MRAHQIMSKKVVTVGTDVSIADAAKLMLEHHVSGLPVLDARGRLAGIVSESDFLRRAEIGTQRKRARFLHFFAGPGGMARDFVQERGRKVGEIMTVDPIVVSEETPLDEIVHHMEKRGIKRLPVVREDLLVGIVTRADLLRAVASLAREIPDPTADDEHVRERVIRAIDVADWRPLGLRVTARKGMVHLHGVITDDRARQAAIVAAENVSGVREVHDHLCFVDTCSGFYLESEEDRKAAEARTGKAEAAT